MKAGNSLQETEMAASLTDLGKYGYVVVIYLNIDEWHWKKMESEEAWS